MSDVLAKICAEKWEHVSRKKREIPESKLLDRVGEAIPLKGFLNSISTKIATGGNALIAEIKKASPSKGLIRSDFSPIDIAKSYLEGGAACLSILTEEAYFQGRDEYLQEVAGSVSLPVLRKDFMLDPYQVIESRVLGADCILLIMAALSDSQSKELEKLAHDLGMDVLIEVHNEEELERALNLDSKLIGINNRNLKTLEIDLKTSEELAQKIPEKYTIICESGISSNNDLQRMNNVGIYSFLVGEHLMSQSDIAKATKELLGN